MSRSKLTLEDFQLQGILGEGSYGKVYCAIDKLNNKKYALKVLDKYHIMKVSLFKNFILHIFIRTKKWIMYLEKEIS